MDGFLEVFKQSSVSFLAAARDEKTLQTKIFYEAMQNLEGRDLIIPDTMLATGNSIVAAADVIGKYGMPRNIFLQAVIAAPEGVRAVQKRLPNAKLYIGSLDKCLNEHGYIVPGLGDAGDLCYGSKENPL